MAQFKDLQTSKAMNISENLHQIPTRTEKTKTKNTMFIVLVHIKMHQNRTVSATHIE